MAERKDAIVADYIMDSLITLMKRKDYHDISITEICENADVARMSFYRNYKSKEDILRKWLMKVTNRFVAESGISYRDDAPRDYFVTLFTHLEKHKSICTALHEAGLVHLLKEEFDRVFLSIHGGEYDDYKSFFHAGGVYNVFLLWLIRGCAETPEELADKLAGLTKK